MNKYLVLLNTIAPFTNRDKRKIWNNTAKELDFGLMTKVIRITKI